MPSYRNWMNVSGKSIKWKTETAACKQAELTRTKKCKKIQQLFASISVRTPLNFSLFFSSPFFFILIRVYKQYPFFEGPRFYTAKQFSVLFIYLFMCLPNTQFTHLLSLTSKSYNDDEHRLARFDGAGRSFGTLFYILFNFPKCGKFFVWNVLSSSLKVMVPK